MYEPSATARTMATMNWDFYRAHIDAGFSPDQALVLTQGMMYSAFIANTIEGKGE